MNIADLIQKSSANFPNNTAIWARGESTTYEEFDSRAKSIANALMTAGVNRGDRVALYFNKCDYLYTSILGILYAGATYVCLNPRYPTQRNNLIVGLAGASALIIESDASHIGRTLAAENQCLKVVLCPDTSTAENWSEIKVLDANSLVESPDLTVQSVEDDALCYIMFTSGTTGKPKGVPISHKNVYSYLQNLQSFAGKVEPTDRVIQVADITFDISVHDMFYAWTNGASLISIPENAGLMSPRFVREHEVTHWFTVPSTARLLNEANLLKPNSLTSLRCSFFCGEPLVASVATAWSKAVGGSPIYNLYGPTEGTVAMAGRVYDRDDFEDHEIVSLGLPFGTNKMKIYDLETKTLIDSCDVEGEICISGDQITVGYWDNENLNKEKFFCDEHKNIWYRTGDLGKIDPEKGFVFVGRVDHQVKIRGFRVEIGEIERTVRSASASKPVAVIPWPLSKDGAALGVVAFIGGEYSVNMNQNIIKICKAALPDYMVPNLIHFIGDLPLNQNGKIDYQALSSHPCLNPVEK